MLFKKGVTGFVMVFLMLFCQSGFCAEVDFVFDFQPLSFLFSPDIDGFTATHRGYYYESEEVEGIGSFMPTLLAGISLDMDPVAIDVKGGAGYLWNGAFSSPMVMGDVALNFRLGHAVTLGPHVGLVNISNPEWSGDAELELDSTSGILAGLNFTAGKTISFIMSLDYFSAEEMDVEGTSGWRVSEDTLDLTGFALRMGIQGRF